MVAETNPPGSGWSLPKKRKRNEFFSTRVPRKPLSRAWELAWCQISVVQTSLETIRKAPLRRIRFARQILCVKPDTVIGQFAQALSPSHKLQLCMSLENYCVAALSTWLAVEPADSGTLAGALGWRALNIRYLATYYPRILERKGKRRIKPSAREDGGLLEITWRDLRGGEKS